MKKKIVAILLCCFFSLIFFLSAYAEIEEHQGRLSILDYDFSEIDWTITKREFEEKLQDTEYEEITYNNQESALFANAYLFGNKASISMYFNSDGTLDQLCAYIIDDDGYTLSPTYIISVLASNLGIPAFDDDPFGEDTGHSYYLWHRALWLSSPSAIFVYTSDDELPYSLDDRFGVTLNFDIMLYGPEIHIFPWGQFEEVIDWYDIDER